MILSTKKDRNDFIYHIRAFPYNTVSAEILKIVTMGIFDDTHNFKI